MSHLRLRPITVALALVASLAGCASLTRSHYETPRLDTPAAWLHGSGAKAPAASATPERWWEAFHDPALNVLVDEAIRSNNDLAAAGITLQKARLSAQLAGLDLSPAPSANISQNASRPLRGDKTIDRNYGASAKLSWQADLWGKLSHTRDAAQWEAEATEQDRDATLLTLTGEVASGYWKLAYLNERVRLAGDNLQYTEQTLELTRRRFAAGAVSRLDVLSAEQDIASQRASLASLVQQREETRTSFALLFGGSPQRRFEEAQGLPEGDVPAVLADLPAALLAARPDLQAAELRLRKTLATGDATRASYYPDFTLTGSLGNSSERLHSILNNPVAAIASEISFPFLSLREMRINDRISLATYELAVTNFRQTFYTALGDVENALSARQQYKLQAQELQHSLEAAREVEKINEMRYRNGAIPLQTWLDAQQTRRTAEASLAETRYNLFTAQSTLNLALGGRFTN